MDKLLKLIAGVLLPLAYLPLPGQPYSFRSIEVEDGLSQNMVYCVLQDRSGFIWIGTQNGLNRYDGDSFRIFGKDSDSGLTNDAIFSLAEDSDGNIWVGTLQGLHIYDPVGEAFRLIPLRDASGTPVEGIVRDIECSADGNTYVTAADTCIIMLGRNLEPKQVELGEAGRGIRIRDIQHDSDGNLWIASYIGGLLEVQKGTGKVRSFPFGGKAGRMFSKVVPRDNETLLVGTLDHGVLEFNIRTGSFSSMSGMDGGSVRFVHDILVDSQGAVWVGSENGLHISSGGSVTRLSHGDNPAGSISDNAVFCITEDCDGGVWVGTYFGGVNYYSKYSSLFRKYYPVPGTGSLKGKNISEFCSAPDGSIWIGTEDAGLHRFHPEDDIFESGFLPAGNIHALSIIDGRLWAGSYGDGLFVLDSEGRTLRHYMLSGGEGAPGDDSIYSLLQDVSGKIWVGTESGLFRYDSRRDRFERTAGDLIFRQVNDILQDFDGNIWFATMGQGVFRYAPETGLWSNLTGVAPYTTCILEDSEHNLWFGTEGAGICFYDHRSKSFKRRWTEADGLPNDMIYKLLEDNSGGIWGSTNHGLFHLTPYRDKVLRFDHRSGLVGDQFNFKSGMKAPDGTFYFGGVKGFVSFVPENFRFPARKAKLVFNRFLLFNREVKPGRNGSPLQKSIIFEEEITLRPRHGMFSIGFADLDYTSSDIKTYQYRLVGHDREWINLEHTHLLSFSNLSPGHYRLEVRANPLNSFPGDTVKSLDIKVLPPWYRTPAAYTAMALLLLALAYFIIRKGLEKVREHNHKLVMQEIERRMSAKTSAELKFLERMNAAIDAGLSDPDFSVSALADALHMSRATLYRKINKVSGASGTEIIKQRRLERAAKLLAEKTYQVSEVADLTGWGSVSYFSRCFRARFGVSPKDYPVSPAKDAPKQK